MTNRSTLLLAMAVILVGFYALLVLRPEMRMRIRQALPIAWPDAYSALERDLARFKADGLAGLQSVGKSRMGRTIYAVGPKTARTRPDFGRLLIVSGQHGVEPLPVEAMKTMIGSGRFKGAQIVIEIILVANPDGYVGYWRGNTPDPNNDMNRDWYRPTKPENKAIAAFIEEFKPDVVIDLHEGLRYSEVAQSSSSHVTRLAAAGFKNGKGPGYHLERIDNRAGVGKGLLHRCVGAEGRVGLMVESDAMYGNRRLPAYTGFVSGVVDQMGKEHWRRHR